MTVFAFLNRSIVVYATVRLTPMLQQIRNGMKIYNLLEVIGRHESLCSNLFVPIDENDDTAVNMSLFISGVLFLEQILKIHVMQ